MIKIEDLKVGDVLIGKYTNQEYNIVLITKNNNIFIEYEKCGIVLPGYIETGNLINYILKPKQTKTYVVIWRDKNNKIHTDKLYNEHFLNDIKNKCDVLDVLEYYEDI